MQSLLLLYCLGLVQNLQEAYNASLGLNEGLPKINQMPQLGGIRTDADKLWLRQETEKFPKTSSMRAGRFPYQPDTRFAKFKGFSSFSSLIYF